MQAVVRVDAAPGFEESVEAQLRYTQGVQKVVFDKQGNYDFLVLCDVKDAADLEKLLNSRLRLLSGVKGVEHEKQPGPEMMRRLA